MNKELWEKCVKFHGHECPGLAIGFRACEIAKEVMNFNFSSDEEIVCVTENDACGVDAVQVITGCTMGKGNLIYRARGKMAFSFFDRKTNKSVRVILKTFDFDGDRSAKQKYILEGPWEEIFDVKKTNFELPSYARLFKSVICEKCGESTSENNVRLQDGKKVCLDCYENYSRGW